MKGVLLLLLTSTLYAAKASAQNKDDFKIDTIDLTRQLDPAKSLDTGIKFFTLVESKPIFPGGIQEFYKFLNQNIDIPPALNIKGKVIVSFVIDLNGDLVETKIIKGIITEGMKKEILVAFNKSPKWKPAIQNGKPVKVLYAIPLNF